MPTFQWGSGALTVASFAAVSAGQRSQSWPRRPFRPALGSSLLCASLRHSGARVTSRYIRCCSCIVLATLFNTLVQCFWLYPPGFTMFHSLIFRGIQSMFGSSESFAARHPDLSTRLGWHWQTPPAPNAGHKRMHLCCQRQLELQMNANQRPHAWNHIWKAKVIQIQWIYMRRLWRAWSPSSQADT